MFKKLLMTVAIATLATSAFANHNISSEDAKMVDLKDGATVHVFKNGKMAMENKFGLVRSMKPGEVMEAKDGQKIAMEGNETARLGSLSQKDHTHRH